LGKGNSLVTAPLILQIQQAALDSNSSVTDALRKAKLACTKLGLSEFGKWVDRELNGYFDIPVEEVPNYRKLLGIPMAYDFHQGWLPIDFRSAEEAEGWSHIYLGESLPAIEENLRGASTVGGAFGYPYPANAAASLARTLPSSTSTRFNVKVSVSQITQIVNVVRNMILDWSIDMEKQGILGADLIFNEEERAKSAAATAATVNNIHIGQVGSFVQSAENSIVQGGVDAVLNLDRVRQFVEQVEQLLSGADVPKSVKEDTEAALSEVKQAAAHPHERGKLTAALRAVGRAAAPAGAHLLKVAVDARVARLLGPG
jgi:hypothetical protein